MTNLQKAREELYALKDKNKFERMLYTAAIITELLAEHRIKPIIVGGLSVEIYTINGYTTEDIDFVMDGYEIADGILTQLDFHKIGKNWVHPIIGISLEIPGNFLTGDYNKVTELAVSDKKVYVIGLEDIILDRLRSAIHWKSGQDREWGIQSRFQHPDEKAEFDRWLHEANIEISQKEH